MSQPKNVLEGSAARSSGSGALPGPLKRSACPSLRPGGQGCRGNGRQPNAKRQDIEASEQRGRVRRLRPILRGAQEKRIMSLWARRRAPLLRRPPALDRVESIVCFPYLGVSTKSTCARSTPEKPV